MQTSLFNYDSSLPIEIETVHDVIIEDIRFASPSGHTIEAYWVAPSGDGPYPGILYVHWYESHSILSNRMEFLSEAVAMAKEGLASLLISTIWSDTSWYRQRNIHDDHDQSIKQVIDLRRAVDVLASRPQVDKTRLGYVGHDFGAMYGAVMATADSRIKTYVLLAGTVSFNDWYLYGDPLQGAALEAYRQNMSKFDPVKYVGQAPSVFFQFAQGDFYVPEDKAQLFFEAASEPKKMETYVAGHDLDDRARHDRVQWLRERLGA
jgi:dienelactone hydrolase